jgi:MFS family permease
LSIFIPVCFCAGVLLYTWVAVRDLPGLYVFCVVYGVFGAGAQGLFPASCSSLTADLSKMGVRTGMVFSVVSIACLTGPPLAGALIERRDGDFLYAQIFGGTAFMGAALTLIGARFAHTGLDWKRRM